MSPASTSSTLSRRAVLRMAGAAGIAALAAGCGVPAPRASASPPRLRLLGETLLPSRLSFQGTTVGGLSALDFDAASGTWAALSDDRSDLQPARFYTLRVDMAPRHLVVEPLSVVTLRDARGQAYPARGNGAVPPDPEGLRLLPGARTLLWASESGPGASASPSLHEIRSDGGHVRTFEIPAMLQAGAQGSGPRNNQSFEGLALSPDGRTAWVAMEGALQQDGPLPTLDAPGGACRFTAFDIASGRAVRQLAYVPDRIPVAPKVPGTHADNGVSEVLMLDEHRMLVLERAYALGTGNALRLFEIDTREGSDTLALTSLEAGNHEPAPKRLVADFAQLGLARLDNTEGMAWGPRRPNGRRTLVVVSDDNFNPMQVTQFAAFEYLE